MAAMIKDVFTIVETPAGKPDRWVKIGIAFVNTDGSLNLVLDAFPANARLHVRDRKVCRGEEEASE